MVRRNRWREPFCRKSLQDTPRNPPRSSRRKPTQTLRLSRLLWCPVFSSQRDGWDKHTSDFSRYSQRLWYWNTFCELWPFESKTSTRPMAFLWPQHINWFGLNGSLEKSAWVMPWQRRQPPLWQGSLLDPFSIYAMCKINQMLRDT